MRRGSVLKIAAVGVVGLAVAGAFGYKAMTGKCLLTGACESKAAEQAVVTPVAATAGQVEECPLGCSESKEATVETVAHSHETECAEKAATCTETVAVAEKAESCCKGEAMASDCGEECPPEGCDKPDCCKKVAQKESTEKVGG